MAKNLICAIITSPYDVTDFTEDAIFKLVDLGWFLTSYGFGTAAAPPTSGPAAGSSGPSLYPQLPRAPPGAPMGSQTDPGPSGTRPCPKQK